jgi:hypothetical protein
MLIITMKSCKSNELKFMTHLANFFCQSAISISDKYLIKLKEVEQ